MSNALHDYAKLFEKYAANNGGTGVILAGEDCLALANEMLMDADDIESENAKLRELVRDMMRFFEDGDYCTACEVERECAASEQYNDDCLMRDVFHDRMMEMGVDA